LLFIFYISDPSIFCATPDVSIKLFADDLKAYITHNNEQAKIGALQIFIDKLFEYSSLNELKLQSSKYYALYIGKTNRKKSISLKTTLSSKIKL
jgi:hypothetical protein